MLAPLRACSCAFLFLWIGSVPCQHRMRTQGANALSSPSFVPSSLDSCSVSDACLSSVCAAYNRQTKSHLKILTENETVYVLVYVSPSPFLDGCRLGTLNISWDYDCVNGRDVRGKEVVNGSANDGGPCPFLYPRPYYLDPCASTRLSP